MGRVKHVFSTADISHIRPTIYIVAKEEKFTFSCNNLYFKHIPSVFSIKKKSIYPMYKYEILIFKIFTHDKKMKYTFLISPMKSHHSYFYILIHFFVLKTNVSMSFK